MILALLLTFGFFWQNATAQTSEKILYIGTSQSMTQLGRTIAAEIGTVYPNSEIDSYWVAGSEFGHWVRAEEKGENGPHTMKLQELPYSHYIKTKDVAVDTWDKMPDDYPHLPDLSKKNYSYFILELGANEIVKWCQRPKEMTERLQQLKDHGAGRRCVWLGPPDISQVYWNEMACPTHEQYEKAVSQLKNAVEEVGCTFFDLRKYRSPTTKKQFPKNFIPKTPGDCRKTGLPLPPDDEQKSHWTQDKAKYIARCLLLDLKQLEKRDGILSIVAPDGGTRKVEAGPREATR